MIGFREQLHPRHVAHFLSRRLSWIERNALADVGKGSLRH
jgi:hypothetical protein